MCRSEPSDQPRAQSPPSRRNSFQSPESSAVPRSTDRRSPCRRSRSPGNWCASPARRSPSSRRERSTKPTGQLIIDAGAAKVKARRQAVGDEQPGKILWLFTTGNQFTKKFDAAGKFVKWEHIDFHGGSYSDINLAYAAMNQAFLSTLANAAADPSRAVHETGHYLGLPHTHRQSFADIEALLSLEERKLEPAPRFALWKERIGAKIAKEISADLTLKAAAEAYDTDRSHNVFDTPADPAGGMIALANEVAGKGNNPYGPIHEVTITVPGVTGALVLSPMRDNVMSYFLDDKTSAVMRLTPDQIKRARANLSDNPQRPRLVAAQLGDSATPDLRVYAVWGPNANAQRLTWNRSLASHTSEHDTMRAKRMALAHVPDARPDHAGVRQAGGGMAEDPRDLRGEARIRAPLVGAVRGRRGPPGGVLDAGPRAHRRGLRPDVGHRLQIAGDVRRDRLSCHQSCYHPAA